MKVKLYLLILTFIPSIAMAALSPLENQIRDQVMKQQAAQLSLLKKLVNINSGTMNIPGVMRVGEIVRAQLKSLGFKTRWIYETADLHRAPTLIAERQGTGNRLLLIGHLDTVFAANSPFKHFELQQHNAKGPGVIDDKGGIVVVLYALKSLRAVHALNNTSITIVLTGDEEDAGRPTSLSRKPLLAVAQRSDVALDVEPTITLETATVARRGISQWTIESHGNESHSATIFQQDVGDGAIFELSRILNTLRTQLEYEPNLSFNPGMVGGGTLMQYDNKTAQGIVFGKQNVVAKIALAKGDVRFIDDHQKVAFKTTLTGIVNQHLPGTASTVTFEDGAPAMMATENNLKLLEKYSEVSLDLHQGPIKPYDPAKRGAADISYCASLVPANLSGLGPMGWGAHSVNEGIELNSLPIQTERLAILIYRLTH